MAAKDPTNLLAGSLFFYNFAITFSKQKYLIPCVAESSHTASMSLPRSMSSRYGRFIRS